MSAMSNITLRQIEAFLAVAQERKFAAAAERLHVSAHYLSQTIKQLEHALGYTLLTRTTRSVELTPAGGVFTGLAERALADLERAIQAAGTIARPPKANLRLGYTIGAGLDIVPTLLRTFAAEHPDCQVQTEEYDFGEPSGGLRDHASPAYPKDTNSPTENPSLLPTCFPSRSSLPPRRSARGATTGYSPSTAPPQHPS
jgi:Bacterial regulatory helix-turn-helix protein, lysR family